MEVDVEVEVSLAEAAAVIVSIAVERRDVFRLGLVDGDAFWDDHRFILSVGIWHSRARVFGAYHKIQSGEK